MLLPVLVFLGGVGLAFAVGGAGQAVVVAVLAVFEVVMSFNNAVINAGVLQRLDRTWQRMFLTVGLLFAVVGMRLFFPVAIVAVTAGLGYRSVIDLALHHPALYAGKLDQAHPLIAAFGGVFLLMLFLDFVLDESKEVHWIAAIERPAAWAGRFKPLSVLIVLAALGLVVVTWAGPDAGRVLEAGLIGLAVYLAVKGLNRLFSGPQGSSSGLVHGRAALALFVYLEVLDASFSLDGVVGAFAITNNVVTIALGLGIGAFFVRELTVRLVRGRALQEFVYLEHGAQYSVGVLAVLLAAGLAYDIPGVVTGLAGAVIIGLALVSSVAERRRPTT